MTVVKSVNRWISARFNILSSAIVGVTAVLVLVSPSISAAQAGFALAFASTVSMEVWYCLFAVDLRSLIFSFYSWYESLSGLLARRVSI